VLIWHDITEAKQLEQKLRNQTVALDEANRLKDEFLATLSHELRTPLNAIVGWSHMLLECGLQGQPARRALEAIARNAEAQRALIEDVLDVSRIITGKLRINVQPVDIGQLVESAIDSIRPAADAKQIALGTSFDPEGKTVVGDAARLQQVFWNLLSNAVKFTPQGGRVDVTVTTERSLLLVRVTDNGIGISKSFLPHVFERFSQFDSSTTRRHAGLGMGLAIVRHLVELHGGTVAVQSEGPGRGTSFTVRLPFRAIAWPQPARPLLRETADAEPAVLGPRLGGVRLLAVDDEAEARELLSTLLTMAGAHVVVAASAAEAIDQVVNVQFDVIVADIGMPEVDGYELIAMLRERGVHAPAIALTAYGRMEDRARVLTAGYHAHLAKPVQPDHLLGTIAAVLKR
jgi:CheY-like chemotaxis protein